MALEKFHDQSECPLCMEPLEMDDINFYPCTCGYQICRFCWHRIRTNENGLCPACRKQYPEDPAEYKPLTAEELQKIKNEKRQKDIQKKQKVLESRKLLSQVRVVQKNLVFIVGLTQKLADPEVLKKHEYFGRFGKIHKIVINTSTTYAGSGGPTASAYITYFKVEDALRAINYINHHNTMDGRVIKSSLGTTKYCSHFLKGSSCPKTDCMYLHEMGEEGASFTKEDMQAGRHQEYEVRLLEHTLSKELPMSTINTLTTTLTASSLPNSIPPPFLIHGHLSSSSLMMPPPNNLNYHHMVNNLTSAHNITTGSLDDGQPNVPFNLPRHPLCTQVEPPTPRAGLDRAWPSGYYPGVGDDHDASPPPSPPFGCHVGCGLPPLTPTATSSSSTTSSSSSSCGDDNGVGVGGPVGLHPQQGTTPPTRQRPSSDWPPVSAEVGSAASGSSSHADPTRWYNGYGRGNSEHGNNSAYHHHHQPTIKNDAALNDSHRSHLTHTTVHKEDHLNLSKDDNDPDENSQDSYLSKISHSLSRHMELIYQKKMAAASQFSESQETDPDIPYYRRNNTHHNHQSTSLLATISEDDSQIYSYNHKKSANHSRHLSGPSLYDTTMTSLPQHPPPHHSFSSSSSLSAYTQHIKDAQESDPTDPSIRHMHSSRKSISSGNGFTDYTCEMNNLYSGKSRTSSTTHLGMKPDKDPFPDAEYPAANNFTKISEAMPSVPMQQRYEILLRDGQRKVLNADIRNSDNYTDSGPEHGERALALDISGATFLTAENESLTYNPAPPSAYPCEYQSSHLKSSLGESFPKSFRPLPQSLQALSTQRLTQISSSNNDRCQGYGTMEDFSSSEIPDYTSLLAALSAKPPETCQGTDDLSLNRADANGNGREVKARADDEQNDQERLESQKPEPFPDWQEAFGFGPSQKHIEDDLGFDPWNESAKALAELIQQEQQRSSDSARDQTSATNSHNRHHQQATDQAGIDPRRHPTAIPPIYYNNNNNNHNNNHEEDQNCNYGGGERREDGTFYNQQQLSPFKQPLQSNSMMQPQHFDSLLSQIPLGASSMIPPFPNNPGNNNPSPYPTLLPEEYTAQQDGTYKSLQQHQNQHFSPIDYYRPDNSKVFPVPSPAAAMMLNLLSTPPSSSGAPHPNYTNMGGNVPNNTLNTIGGNIPADLFAANNSNNASYDKNTGFNAAFLTNMLQQFMLATNGGGVGTGPYAAGNQANFFGGMSPLTQTQILNRLQQMMAYNSLVAQQDQMNPVGIGSSNVPPSNLNNFLSSLAAGINGNSGMGCLPFLQLVSGNTGLNSNNINTNSQPQGPTGILNQQNFAKKYVSPLNSNPSIPPHLMGGNSGCFNFPPPSAASPFGMKEMAETLKAAFTFNNIGSGSPPSTNNSNSNNNNSGQSYLPTPPSPFLTNFNAPPGSNPALNGFRIPAIPPSAATNSLLNAAAYLNQQQMHGFQVNFRKGPGVDRGSLSPPLPLQNTIDPYMASNSSPHSLLMRSMLSPPFNQLLSAAAATMSPIKFLQQQHQPNLHPAGGYTYNRNCNNLNNNQYGDNTGAGGNDHDDGNFTQQTFTNGGMHHGSSDVTTLVKESNMNDNNGYCGNSYMNQGHPSHNSYGSGGAMMEGLGPHHQSPIMMGNPNIQPQQHYKTHPNHRSQIEPGGNINNNNSYPAQVGPPSYMNFGSSSHPAPPTHDTNYGDRGQLNNGIDYANPYPSGPNRHQPPHNRMGTGNSSNMAENNYNFPYVNGNNSSSTSSGGDYFFPDTGATNQYQHQHHQSLLNYGNFIHETNPCNSANKGVSNLWAAPNDPNVGQALNSSNDMGDMMSNLSKLMGGGHQ